MSNSIEWEIIDKRNNDFKKILKKLDTLENKYNDLEKKIENIDNKIDKIIEVFDSDRDEQNNTNNMNISELNPFFINRMTNRLWRNSSYTTTPNSFFNILNKNKT